MGQAKWTETECELVAKLWREGFSASQITHRICNGKSRNAVIGIIHRMGLSGIQDRKTKFRLKTVKKSNKPTAARRKTDGLTLIAEPFKPRPEIDIPEAQRLTILVEKNGALHANEALTDARCRWPKGDPSTHDFYLCGGEAISGLPYCKAHCEIAYVPVPPRKEGGSFEFRLPNRAIPKKELVE